METPLKLNSQKKGPKVLIYHTHTTESFITDLGELEKLEYPTELQMLQIML